MRYMVAGAFFFSVMSLGVKLVGQRVPSQEVVLVRGVLNALFTLGLLWRARVRPWGRRPGMLLLRGLFGFASLSCLYYALVHLPLAEATVLQYTNPVWSLWLSAVLLGERFTRSEAALSLVGLSGVLIILRPSILFGSGVERLDPVAVVAGLAGALFSACAYVTVRKLARTEHPLVIVFYFTLVTIPASVPSVLLEAVWPSPHDWLLLLGVAVAAQGGQVYLTRGLQLEPAGRATAVGYIQIVFAGLWGLLFLGDVPDFWSIVGGLVVIGSTLLISVQRRPPPGMEPGRAAAGYATSTEDQI